MGETRPNLDEKRGLISWNQSCSYVASLVKKYPTGVTKSIVLTELEKRFNPRTKALANRANPDQHIQKEWKNITINSIAETKQVNINAVVECYIEDGFFLAGTKTRVVRLTDKTILFSKSSLSEVDRCSVEMYLHQKLYQLEKKFSEHELRVTNLRIHRVGKSEAYRILPREYFVILLNGHENKEFINSNFSTFKGIQNEENAPHYTRDVLMKVTNIDPVETIYYPDGSNAKRCIVNLIDKDRIEAKFILWEEHTAFRNLFNVDDMLAIEKPFCVTENETFFVEYGSLTIIHVIPAETTKELVASQAKQAQSFHMSKTASGKLDYFLYPMRIYTMDIQEDMINVTLVGVITYKTPKLVFEDSDHNGHTFTVSLTDEYGSIKLTVLDHQCSLHGSLQIGQMIIAENFAVNGNMYLFYT